MFKNMKLVILFDMFHNPSFEMRTISANIGRTPANTSIIVYLEKFQIIRNWVFI